MQEGGYDQNLNSASSPSCSDAGVDLVRLVSLGRASQSEGGLANSVIGRQHPMYIPPLVTKSNQYVEASSDPV